MKFSELHPDIKKLYNLVAIEHESNQDEVWRKAEKEANELMKALTAKLESIEELSESRDFYKNSLEIIKAKNDEVVLSVDFPFGIGEHVYYAQLQKLSQGYSIAEGTVFGYSVYGRKSGLDIRINFKQDSVPADYASTNKQTIENLVSDLNQKLRKEFSM